MKKFTKLLICLMLCVFSFGLIACGDDRTPKEKNFSYPSASDTIVGNGGLAVQKGNYIYFVNGYKSLEDVSNKNDSYVVGSLMLMKLGANGEVVTDENGLLKDEYYIYMSGALCGYEVTNLYIHNDYLYFATPCLENESGDKVWAKERVIIKRIKLDKTGEVEDVYCSGVKYDSFEYDFYEENGNLFILAWEKGDSYYADNGKDALIRVNATALSSEHLSQNVSSVVFADNGSEIFYVKEDADNSKYYLKQYNIFNNQTVEYTTFTKSITAEFAVNGYVYITTRHDVGSSTDLMVSQIETKAGFELLYAYESDVTLNMIPDGTAMVAISKNIISLVRENESVVTITDENATSIKVVGYVNGCIVYYAVESDACKIKYVSYYNKLNGGSAEIVELTSFEAIEDDYIYFDLGSDDHYMYFYKKQGSNYYLNRLKVKNNLEEKEEVIGVYLEADKPEIEDDKEGEEE